MRISQAAIDECASLFVLHVDTMKALVAYQGELFDIVAKEKTLCWRTLRILTNYQFDRSQAAYCLFVNGFVWDAEIIIRAVYEVMAKIVFIGASDTPSRNDLFQEFWTVLPSIYDKKGAQKAKPAERLAKTFGDDDDARIFARIQDPKLFDLDHLANRKARKEIEQRWSFYNIIETLRSNSDRHRRVPGLEALPHIYGIASHLAHASPIAIDLMMDRATRGDDLHCLEVSHVCRMMSDLVSLGCFSLQFCEFAISGQWKMSNQLQLQFDRMNEAIVPFRLRFSRSQDDFYDRHDSTPKDDFCGE